MKILVLSDIHNDTENIINYIDKLLLLDFDVIVAVGDFTDVNLPKGFSNIDMGEIIIEELGILKKPILERCPNCRLKKEDFARIRVEIVEKKSREIIEILYGEIICIDCLLRRYKNKTSLRLYV